MFNLLEVLLYPRHADTIISTIVEDTWSYASFTYISCNTDCEGECLIFVQIIFHLSYINSGSFASLVRNIVLKNAPHSLMEIIN